jgi:hypothetical protein
VLLATSARSDPSAVDSTRLQISAFEAINDMVRAASNDTLDTVGQLTPVFLQEISKTFSMSVTNGEQREKQAELQGQLCGVLQVRACGCVGVWVGGAGRQLRAGATAAGRRALLHSTRPATGEPCSTARVLPHTHALKHHAPCCQQVIMQKLSEVDQYKAAVLQYADEIMSTLLQVRLWGVRVAGRGLQLSLHSAALAVPVTGGACLPCMPRPHLRGHAGFQQQRDHGARGGDAGGGCVQLRVRAAVQQVPARVLPLPQNGAHEPPGVAGACAGAVGASLVAHTAGLRTHTHTPLEGAGCCLGNACCVGACVPARRCAW